MSNVRVFVNFTIDPDQKQKLVNRCKTKGVSISTVIRLLISGYLDGTIVLPSITKAL